MAKPKTKADGTNKSKAASKGTKTPTTKAVKTEATGSDPVKIYGEKKAKRLGLI